MIGERKAREAGKLIWRNLRAIRLKPLDVKTADQFRLAALKAGYDVYELSVTVSFPSPITMKHVPYLAEALWQRLQQAWDTSLVPAWDKCQFAHLEIAYCGPLVFGEEWRAQLLLASDSNFKAERLINRMFDYFALLLSGFGLKHQNEASSALAGDAFTPEIVLPHPVPSFDDCWAKFLAEALFANLMSLADLSEWRFYDDYWFGHYREGALEKWWANVYLWKPC